MVERVTEGRGPQSYRVGVHTLINSAHNELSRILRQVRRGALSVPEALRRLSWWPSEDLGYARVDHQRALRQQLPEAIYSTGKRPEQVIELLGRIVAQRQVALATRVPPDWAEGLQAAFPGGHWHDTARLFVVSPTRRKPTGRVRLAVAAAGTADLPAAEEAAVTAEAYGLKVARIYDVGVAGLHRLLARTDVLRQARAVIVVAGMDGALPSVVGGLVAAPVIAVPTSVGYGASFQGLSALLTMLNSCAPGVLTVNIDNGYGAAVAAYRILRTRR
jgi:NCAIR mutase (PurE)-related protein